MQFKNFLLAGLTTIFGGLLYGQDLVHRVPASSEFVTVINNKAIVNHSSFEKINEVLTKLGAFEGLNADDDLGVNSILDLSMAYDRNAYIYRSSSDSSYYVGLLIPLKTDEHIAQRLFKSATVLPESAGFHRRASTDGKMRAAWNKDFLFVLMGESKNNYFEIPEVAERYGIELADTDMAWEYQDLYAEEAAIAVDTAYAMVDSAYAAIDTSYTEAYAEAEAVADSAATAYVYDEEEDAEAYEVENYPSAEEPYDYSDDEYDNSAYTDSVYLAEMARVATNDSIRNALFAQWLAADFEGYLNPAQNISKRKGILDFDQKKTLIHLWVSDLNELYKNSIPYDVMNLQFGLNMRNMDYGYKEATLDLTQDKNTLKLAGSVELDKEMEEIFKKIYSKKINKKFGKYIPQNHLGYLSLNISTEEYLKQIPAILERWYAPLVYDHKDLISIGSLALEIATDEKAVAKVMNGDNLLFINSLQKVEREYVDYEYDDDYNYTEVTKTKEEYIPSFLWMFTSQDQRLYKKLLIYAEKMEKAVSIDHDLFRFSENDKSMQFYVLFKQDMVFLSNDSLQITQIKENRFKSTNDAKIKRDIRNNTMNAVVHAAEIPQTINKLGLPIIGSWKKSVDELAQYGDISIRANGVKNKKISGEMSIDFPSSNENALQYLLQQMLDNLEDNN